MDSPRFEILRLAAMQETEDVTELTVETDAGRVTLVFRRGPQSAVISAALSDYAGQPSPSLSGG